MLVKKPESPVIDTSVDVSSSSGGGTSGRSSSSSRGNKKHASSGWADGTEVSLSKSGLIAIGASVVFIVLMFPLKDYYLGELFLKRGWVPFALVFLMSWSATILILKYFKLAKQKDSMLFDTLPTDISEEISEKTVPKFIEHVSNLPVDPRESFLVNRVLRGLEHFSVLKSSAEKEMNSANAIHAWHSKDMTIKNNRVSGHRDGLYFEFCDNSVIENNHSKGNLRYGLHFMFSNFNEYRNNTFEENGAGVAVMYSDNIEMVGNKFVNNWGSTSFGLLLKEIKDSKIHNNLFYGNTKAIYGESAIRINIYNNDFVKNGWAMQMMSSSELDTITYNNFIGNTFNISTNQNARNYNLYENNYWSDYSGYDLDKDGIGDVPHRPVKFFSQVLGFTPEAIILLRSFFIELLNFIENIVPVLTPDNLKDVKPMVKKIDNDSVPRHI